MKSQRKAQLVFVGSALLLAGVAVGVWGSGSSTARVDLTGEPVQLTPSARASSGFGRIDNASRRTRVLLGTPTVGSPSVPGSNQPTNAAAVLTPGAPVRLTIPSLAMFASVKAVGLESDGSMEIPADVEAGWYHYGPRPGDSTGSAVIAGHIDHERKPGVFFELRGLQLGETVVVSDRDGVDHRFVVSERFQVEKESLPLDELFREDGDPVLTLISCGGAFDRKARRYTDNIVIRAVPA